MLKRPSARELVNAHLGKKLSPQGQAVIDSLKHLRDPGDETEPADDAQPIDDAAPSAEDPSPNVIHSAPAEGSRQLRKAALLQLIAEKLESAEAQKTKATKPARTKPAPSTRAEINRANSINSTGPRTPEGKARVSANSLKTGFFANVDRLNPQDSPSYLDTVDDLRMGLHPDGPVEEQLIRELAMFRARLLRLESAEYALLCADIETKPERTDGFVVRDQEWNARELAAGYINNSEALDRLSKAEVHLRRAYNRTWDRLERMQKERKKLPFQEALKQTQLNATYEAVRTTCPKCSGPDGWKKHAPPLHPDLDENANLKKYPAGHPLYRPKDDDLDAA